MSASAPIRVVLTGSECTGKTTLARELAESYGATLVPEHAREYAMNKSGELDVADAEAIARRQIAMEDAAIALAPRLIVEDTDVLSTAIYCEHYHGSCPPWIRHAARERRPDLYLLLEIDVPWIADDVRDRGHLREEVQQLFRDDVAASGSHYVTISGSWSERTQRARAAMDALIAAREGEIRFRS